MAEFNYWRHQERPHFKRMKDIVHVENYGNIQFSITDFWKGRRGWQADVYFFWPECGCKYETDVYVGEIGIGLGSAFVNITNALVYIFTEEHKEYGGKCPICSATNAWAETPEEPEKEPVVGCLRMDMRKAMMDYSIGEPCEDLKKFPNQLGRMEKKDFDWRESV